MVSTQTRLEDFSCYWKYFRMERGHFNDLFIKRQDANVRLTCELADDWLMNCSHRSVARRRAARRPHTGVCGAASATINAALGVQYLV